MWGWFGVGSSATTGDTAKLDEKKNDGNVAGSDVSSLSTWIGLREPSGMLNMIANMIEGKDEEDVERSAKLVPLPWENDAVPLEKRPALEASIRGLGKSRRTFMEHPPGNAEFVASFKFEDWAPLAARMLEVDKELSRFRWDLVPSKITEEKFFRNYFYRVSLVTDAAAVLKIPSTVIEAQLEEMPQSPPLQISAAPSAGDVQSPPITPGGTPMILEDETFFVTDEGSGATINQSF